MDALNYKVGDIVELKKPHPCISRSKLFEILKVGADIKVRCLGCDQILIIPRDNFNHRLKAIKESK